MADKAVKVAVIGCGAISELFYAPCLAELEARGEVKVVAVMDPTPARREALRAKLPGAFEASEVSGVLNHEPELVIVASPPKFHADQSIAFLKKGVAVLCEKPMAGTLAEAERMAAAARESAAPLAIGLFRRFYPSSEAVREIVRRESFGKVNAIEVVEGGVFNWPAASPSFFRKSESQGGVLADLGVHVLDLLIWWFGYPESFDYADDAMGGLEANCVLSLEFKNGIKGRVRLSRDTNLRGGFTLKTERAELVWQAGSPNQIQIRVPGVAWSFDSKMINRSDWFTSPDYGESFARQLWSVIESIRKREPVLIPAAEGILSLRLIEECYASRRAMELPWFSEAERERAATLAQK